MNNVLKSLCENFSSNQFFLIFNYHLFKYILNTVNIALKQLSQKSDEGIFKFCYLFLNVSLKSKSTEILLQCQNIPGDKKGK